MALPPKLYQFLIGIFASLGSWLYGYDLGVIAEVISSGSFLTLFNNPDANSTGLIVSLFTAGAFVGAFLAGPCGDILGRRGTIAAGTVFFCIGGAVQTGAQTISYLWGGRFLAGTGIGFLVMIIPLYQAELAHPDIRGTITALQQFMLGVGALLAAWISYGTFVGLPDSNSGQWRIPLGLQLIPAVLLGLLIFLFPESPRWLIDHGQHEKGLTVLAKLHAHGNENDPWVRAEYEQIREQLAFEHENEAQSYKELFVNKSAFRRLLIAMALQASVQMTGVSAIQYYSVKIYGQVGITGADTLKYQAISSIIALVGEGLNIAFVDRFGRRWPLIGGNLGNCLTFIIATILIAQFPAESTNTGAHWGFTIMTWLYNFSFSATCGPLSWIIPAEIFDTHTRSKGVSIATMTSFAFNTMIGQVTSVALPAIGWRYYLVFVVCNFTNAVFFWAVLPETRRVPLEEMHALFTEAPLFVAGRDMTKYRGRELEARAASIAGEKGVGREIEGERGEEKEVEGV